jgi:hypothetical protein
MRRTRCARPALLISIVCGVTMASAAGAQELIPNAYTVAPVGMNVVTVGTAYNKGDVTFDPSAPVEDARATILGSTLGYGRVLSIAGRSAQVAVIVPYLRGHLQGLLAGQFQQVSRSGLGDTMVRFGINLYGAPAMRLKEFAAYKAKTSIGASLIVQAPLGQYDNTKLINLGNNRWAFKPEVGFSRVRGQWTYEVYGGMWFFGDNTDYLRGGRRQQVPIVSTQVHVLYTFRRGLWLGGDMNFWKGGRVTVNGVPNVEEQRNSRVGATFAVPVSRRQSLRFAYSRGAYTTIGGDFSSYGVSYACVWGGGL